MEAKITRIIIWIIVLCMMVYFLFLPTNISRQVPKEVAPYKIY
jgi:hypothetical protein